MSNDETRDPRHTDVRHSTLVIDSDFGTRDSALGPAAIRASSFPPGERMSTIPALITHLRIMIRQYIA